MPPALQTSIIAAHDGLISASSQDQLRKRTSSARQAGSSRPVVTNPSSQTTTTTTSDNARLATSSKPWYWRWRWVERIRGMLPFAIFLAIGMTGFAIVPWAFYKALACWDFTYIYLGIFYYTYRYFRPAKEWELVQTFNRSGARWFNNQEVVLDGFSYDDIKPDDGRLFGIHPHGILVVGFCVVNSWPLLAPGKIKYLVTDALMNFPLIGDWMAYNGCSIACKPYMKARMAKKANLALLPGGFEESTLYKRGHYRVFIKERAGFIKYALEQGYKVHPTFVFGEEWTVYAYSGNIQARFWLNKYKLPGVLFMALPLLLLPWYNQDMHVVIGPSIQLPTIPNPTEEDVKKWHGLYMDKLQELFDKHKGKYCQDPNTVLEMW